MYHMSSFYVYFSYVIEKNTNFYKFFCIDMKNAQFFITLMYEIVHNVLSSSFVAYLNIFFATNLISLQFHNFKRLNQIFCLE
jgi:hypothetical protein